MRSFFQKEPVRCAATDSAVRNIGNSWMLKERSNQGRLARQVGEFLPGVQRLRALPVRLA